jgi:glycerol kinase
MGLNGQVLAIDQGTTSSRAMVFDATGRPRARAQIELPQIYPHPGWVEHDPRRLWEDSLAAARTAIAEAGGAERIAAIGLTNQRETTILWERASGRPLHNAIVWQDRRTAEACERWRREGAEPMVRERTGLVLDPYFSASKIAWILDHVEGARARARRGELCFGTVDCFLLWHLSGGRVHATDASNAARTLLFDIRRQRWDEDLLKLFDIPAELLPEVRDSSGPFAVCDRALFGQSLAVTGIAGDQQAATFGQAAFAPGNVKVTYGTGAFLLANTGERMVSSRHRLLTTVAWRLKGRVTYAVEGSIFIAGAALQWLRDGLRVIANAADSEPLARGVDDTGGVYMVPAFAGLGAPYWDAGARGAILGLTRQSGVAEIARAALEAVAYQTRDLTEALSDDMKGAGGTGKVDRLRVDGGLVVNDWAMQFLADMLGVTVERPAVTETTALGAAYLAGMAAGVYGDGDDLAKLWRSDRRFEPAMEEDRRRALYGGWREAVARVRAAG